MITVQAVIVNTRGLHARPSTKLAKLAAQYTSELTIYKGKRKANAKSIAELLMLTAQQGSELKITACGRDEKKAASALLELIASGFKDDAVPNNPQNTQTAPDYCAGEELAVHQLSGVGIGDGVVVGPAHIYNADAAEVTRYRVSKTQLAREINRYAAAVKQVRGEFEMLLQKTAAMPGAAKMKPFIDLYVMLLDDKEFSQKPQLLMRRRLINAEWALKECVEVINDYFRRAQDVYLRERQRDIEQVMKRLLTAMKSNRHQQKNVVSAGEKAIIVSSDLDPADVIRIHQSGYKGFITESGGAHSHTAILARSINMPALLGARGVLSRLQHNTPVLLDPRRGMVIINPASDDIKKHKQSGKKKSQLRRHKSHGQGVMTRDKEQVQLHVNIELPEEAEMAIRRGADGIGLFRTEFLFMHRNDLPGEDEQFEIYRRVLKVMHPLPVVIRTLDIGGDKMPPMAGAIPIGNNPALGVRAIRYCLAMPDLFMTQLRALLRVSTEFDNLRILFPMLAHPQELDRTMKLLSAAQEQVRALQNIQIPTPPLGVMIEVPAAVFIMRVLSKQLSFFSIGTNDLIQYMMAVDRNDESLIPLCDPLHPGILKMLELIVANARRSGLPVTLCGELAGDVRMIPLILGLGLRQLSVTPSAVEEVRAQVQQAHCAELAPLARRVLRATSPETARGILHAALPQPEKT